MYRVKKIVPVGSFYYNYGYVNYSQPLTIGESAFEDCVNLTGSLGAESILMYTKDIGTKAFSGCTSLIKSSKNTYLIIQGVGDNAFENTSLSNFTLDNIKGNTGNDIFNNVQTLTSVSITLSDKNATISENAFRGYTGQLTVNLNGASETNKPWGYTGDNITVNN